MKLTAQLSDEDLWHRGAPPTDIHASHYTDIHASHYFRQIMSLNAEIILQFRDTPGYIRSILSPVGPSLNDGCTLRHLRTAIIMCGADCRDRINSNSASGVASHND